MNVENNVMYVIVMEGKSITLGNNLKVEYFSDHEEGMYVGQDV